MKKFFKNAVLVASLAVAAFIGGPAVVLTLAVVASMFAI